MAIAERPILDEPFWYREQSGTEVEPFQLNRQNFAQLVADRVAAFVRDFRENLNHLPFRVGVNVEQENERFDCNYVIVILAPERANPENEMEDIEAQAEAPRPPDREIAQAQIAQIRRDLYACFRELGDTILRRDGEVIRNRIPE